VSIELNHVCLSVFRFSKGRAIAQAVFRWLFTSAGQVRARIWCSGICGGQSAAGAGFPSITSVSSANIHSIKFTIPTVTWGSCNTPEMAYVPNENSVDSTPYRVNLIFFRVF
jgi:hypothetical protein